MNLVGQLAESVLVTVKELYRGLNPATLSGGIDVVVVRQPDGTLQCSPFHVRFGKLGVLRSREKIVDIEINGEAVALHMKLGDNGEAFFVEENESKETEVPSHLCTSPIPTETPEEPEETPEGSASSSSAAAGSGAARKRKRRRKRMRSDSHLRDEAGSSSDGGRESPAKEAAMLTSKSVYYSLSEEPPATRDAHSDGEQAPESAFLSRPSSDSELLVKPQESRGPQMQWNWGGFPTLCQSERQHFSPSGRSHFCTIERQDSFDRGFEPAVGGVTVVRPRPRTPVPVLASPPPGGGNPHAADTSTPHDLSEEETRLAGGRGSPAGVETEPDDAQTPGREVTATGPPPQGASAEQGEPGAGGGPVGEGDSGIEPCAEDGGPGGAEESPGNSAEASSRVDQQDKKKGAALIHTTGGHEKGKRNHHLGPTGIYLDDLTTLQPEVAALYFPKSEPEGASPAGAEQGSCSGSQSPQSVGAVDSGAEYLSDSASYNMDISMSLCGQEGDTSHITKEKFTQHMVTYQDFANNPEIIEDPSLVICINANYYNWAVAAPMVLSMTTFQKNLPKSTIERLVKDKMPKKSGRWWFSWRKRNQKKNSNEEPGEEPASAADKVKATLDDIDSDEAAGLGRTAMIPSGLSTETLNATQCIKQLYRKSLRLTSEQIEHLYLRDGANKVVFSVTTQYQGTCRCEAAIYLWSWNDHVIISDIDGTITKSDALGHILPQFGKDWTHKGIAKLYHKIHQNGYKFLYCSARAIGMAAITKDYLLWVNDHGTALPQGPVLLAPSSFFSALHREVIEKKPEVFKIACLSDIKDLFTPQRKPFYAAFGNRTNDVFAYKQVGVPDTRLFTVNPKGELIQERTKVSKSSYSHLSELVEHFFPALSVGGSTSTALDCPEYSSFSFWKEPLPELDLDALL
ncbi:phosphatidate phosphatase LPIN2-like isoform X2 [Pseudoliparis swirei]|uniref:phosphatidate phosphatase LPIN2-like isoform X2 n=1 Tax=Pseudoliparis swirei TaxID=2059687 RepID=UPI0024BD5CED|nr:phosphatidate phosphatase LPIN2-like isoform X2 [Pseudoliparis swirei]